MMGYGPYGHGGSYSSSSSPSSSSNLSPLAPPFMVDRSFTKPNSTPLLDLTEPSLSYSAPLSSSLHNWLPSPKPTSWPKFFPKQELESGSVPSTNVYGYRGIQKMESSNTHLPPLNTVPSTSADVLPFGQCSDTLAANLIDAQPYYPSYLPCTTDNGSPLVVPDQTIYDWLSTPHVPSLDGSSHKDYTQISSTSKNSSPWGGLWNELGDWELGKRRELDGSFFSKEADLPVSFYKSYMDQGAHPEDLSTCHVAPLGIDNLGRHGGLVQPEKLDGQSFLGQNPNFKPVDDAKPFFGYGKHETCSINCNISTENLIDESLMRQNPNFMPAENVRCNFGVGGLDTFSSNSQLPNNPSYEKHWRQHDVSMNDRTSISKSTTVVIKPPAAGTSSLATHNASIKAPNFRSAATYPDICSNNSSSKFESHNASQKSEGKVNFDPSHLKILVEKNVAFSSDTLLTKDEDLLNNGIVNNGALDNCSKAKCGLGFSNVSHEDFNLDLKANHKANSVGSIPETVDSCLAVDSPCWKGVPFTSPWQGCESEAFIPQQIKKQEVCDSLNVRSRELFPPVTGYAASSSLKSNENTKHPEFVCLENGIGLHLNISPGASSKLGEQKPADTSKENCHLECGEGFQRSNDIHEIESGFKSYFDCKDSQITQQSLRQELASDIANDESEYLSHLLSNVMDNLCSCDEDGSTRASKSSDQQPTPTIDVLMLVNAMNSISDVLLFHCTNGLYQLKEKDLRAIKSVISNLNISMAKNAEKLVAVSESSSSLEKTSDYIKKQNDLHEPTKTGDPSTQDKHCMSVKEDDKVSESSFMRSDPGIVEDDKMVQALKKVLSENFLDDEETHPQTLMYKNLWLEAEAALCAVNYKARFNRMKMDVGNGKSHKSEDVLKSTAELSSSYVSTEPDKVQAVSSGAEDFPNSKVQISSLSPSSQDDVMARYCILQSRIDNLSASNADEPSSSKFSPNPNEANKEPDRSHEANCGPKSTICNQDSNITCTKNHTNDFEASVMSRFEILKLREDVSRSDSRENSMSGSMGFGYAGRGNDWSIIGPRLEDRSSGEKMEHILQHHTFGNETMKEFHLFDDEDQLVRPPGRNGSGSQLLAGQRGSLSSDWEHIMDEECKAQNH